MKPLIKLENVSKYYKTATSVAEGMRGINLEFYNNEFVAITGESGSGKTTLLNVISGLDSYEDGELYINGTETSHYSVKDFEKYRAQNIGFVFQNYNVIESYSVYQNVVIALEAQNYPKDKIKQRALELIERVGLETHVKHKTAKLSGGQKQRVVIARALAKDAPIILADEPTGNLDRESSIEVLSLLKEISKDKLVILVSHNLEEVRKYATRNIVLEDGAVKNDFKLVETNVSETDLQTYETKERSLAKSFKIAIRNILTTPKRTIFQILLSITVVFAFVYFYGNLIKNATFIETYGTEHEELVLAKRDGSNFNINDYYELNSIKGRNMTFAPLIEIMIEEGVITDFVSDTNLYDDGRFVVVKNAAHLRQKDLTYGVMPQNNYQIIVDHTWQEDDNDNLVGKIIKYNGMEFEVSGVLNTYNYQRVYYFTNDFLFGNNLTITSEAELLFTDTYFVDTLKVRAFDRQEIKNLINKINDDKYQPIDSYGNFEQSFKLVNAIFLILYWGILFLILYVVFIIIFHVSKNMMTNRKIDFAVYRSIGINEKEVGLTILFEQLIIAVIGSLITFTILNVLGIISDSIYKVIRNIGIFDYFIIALIFAIFTLRLGTRFNKQIFNLTVIEALKEDE